jgi:hypothetical protein
MKPIKVYKHLSLLGGRQLLSLVIGHKFYEPTSLECNLVEFCDVDALEQIE